MVCQWNPTSALKKKVTVVGGGNWGSAIACVVGKTVKMNDDVFDTKVTMWVRDSRKPEEIHRVPSLADIINETRENAKYLPGRKLPENVEAETDLVKACKNADFLVFVIPHQGIKSICGQLKGTLKPGAMAISLIKGISKDEENGGLKLISTEMSEELGIDVSVLMGANLAGEVADEKFCEATIGCRTIEKDGELLKKLFDTPNFRIRLVKDVHTVELNGALKNVVACAAGFADGLGWNYNMKSAVIRKGLLETTQFVQYYYPGSKIDPFFESCGVADLITTCFGGRNRKVAEAFVRSDKSLTEVEQELLNGQSAQGPPTAAEVFEMISKSDLTKKFPLFTRVHEICTGQKSADTLLNCLRGSTRA